MVDGGRKFESGRQKIKRRSSREAWQFWPTTDFHSDGNEQQSRIEINCTPVPLITLHPSTMDVAGAQESPIYKAFIL